MIVLPSMNKCRFRKRIKTSILNRHAHIVVGIQGESMIHALQKYPMVSHHIHMAQVYHFNPVLLFTR